MSTRLSVTGSGPVRTYSDSGPPSQDMVKVAVLSPRLPPGMAPPTGLGPAEAFAWDEALNWKHNESTKPAAEASSPKKFLRKAGFTTQRKKANENTPNFTFRMVTHETWRKHYAKDAQGRYRGTYAPAEDCLLLPEDVERWRFDEVRNEGDRYTRGSEALPVYDEARREGDAPGYDAADAGPPPASATEKSGLAVPEEAAMRKKSSFTADGKTSEQIIMEAKAKAEKDKLEGTGSKSWKNTFKRASEFAMLGN